MNENQNRKKLYIPVNVPDSDDYISGIASFELAIIGLSMVVALVVGGLIFTYTGNSVQAVAGAACIISVTLLTVRRDVTNENLIKKINVVLLYTKSQRQYQYRYYNIYEIDDENNGEES